jgi:hypothetical protein
MKQNLPELSHTQLVQYITYKIIRSFGSYNLKILFGSFYFCTGHVSNVTLSQLIIFGPCTEVLNLKIKYPNLNSEPQPLALFSFGLFGH